MVPLTKHHNWKYWNVLEDLKATGTTRMANHRPRSTMWNRSTKILFLFSMACIAALTFENRLRAKLDPIETTTQISIGSKEFGNINHISDLSHLDTHNQHPGEDFTRVSLSRDLVAQPSLYLWAKNNLDGRQGLQDIRLVVKSKANKTIISTYVLKNSKPLHWTLETTEAAPGGFHEKVEFAVQEISIH